MNHGDHTWQSVPNGQPGDIATIDGEQWTCVMLRSGVLWMPSDLAHLTEVRDGQ